MGARVEKRKAVNTNSVEEYHPLCEFECEECEAIIHLVSKRPPSECPACNKKGTVVFVDNVEEDGWRPQDAE